MSTDLDAPELQPLFSAVSRALSFERLALNQADPVNGNHGDHMVAVFDAASSVAGERPDASLSDVLALAAGRLEMLQDNGSALVYARGLHCLSGQFERYNVSVNDLLGYVRQALGGEQAAQSGDVLKALVNGLAAWSQNEAAAGEVNDPAAAKLSMGVLFEFGMAYLQAKQRGGARAQVLADAAASISPLSRVPHRYRSARLAIEALLNAIQPGNL